MLHYLTQHGIAKVGSFLTLAANHILVTAFFLFTDKKTKYLMLIFFFKFFAVSVRNINFFL